MKYLLFDGKAWFDRTPGASIEREADDMLQRYDVVKNCRLSKPLTKPPRGMGCPGAQGGGLHNPRIRKKDIRRAAGRGPAGWDSVNTFLQVSDQDKLTSHPEHSSLHLILLYYHVQSLYRHVQVHRRHLP